MGFFDKLKSGLSKTKNAIVGKIDNLFKSFRKVDEDLFDELEELLISADIGVNTTEEILDELREIGVSDGDREIFEVIMNLPVKYRVVLDLYYIEGYKANEIATITNASPAAVRKQLQHGRRMLKLALEGADSDEN